MDDERLERPTGRWEEVIDEQAAMASSYRESGWDAIELHPGDVAVLTGGGEDDRFGFDVVVPGSEFEVLRDVVDAGATFDTYELFGDVESNMAVVLVVMESTDAEIAALYPVYYAQRTLADVRDAAREAGELYTYVRPLDRRAVVTFTHERPGLFFGESRS